MNRATARAKLESLASLIDKSMQRSYLRMLKTVRDEVALARAVRAIERGDVTGAVEAILNGMGRATAGLRASLESSFSQAARSYMRTSLPATLRTVFTPGSPAAATVFRELDLQLIGPITRSFEEGLRAAVTSGLLRGSSPLAIAREARASVGFTTYDVSLIEGFRLKLLSGDITGALASALRDRRYDGTLRRARDGELTLTVDKISAMTERYAQALESWRAETWSRTAALQATRASQYASWAQGAQDAGVDPHTMTKTWVATLDDRVRDEHAEAHGITVPFDEPFPVDGGVMVPGENVYNCRCTMIVNVLPRNTRTAGSFADVSRASRSERFAEVA